MFERFTEPSRRVVDLAQQESHVLQHDYVGTEHLLIAATQVDDRLTAALGEFGVTTASTRAQVARMVAPSGAEAGGDTKFTPEATAALEGSRREALQLGHDYIAPAHIVLGLLAAHDGTMPVLLTRLGVNPETLRVSMIGVLDDTTPPEPARPAASVRLLCPRCHTALDGNIQLVPIDAAGETIRLAACVSCGAVLPALPGGRS